MFKCSAVKLDVMAQLYQPQFNNDLLWRDEIYDVVINSLKCHIFTVSAPAGYGKTSLLALWRKKYNEQGIKSSWLSINPEYNDSVRFLSHLIASIREHHKDFRAYTIKQLKNDEYRVLKSLIDDFVLVKAPFVIFIDDYHFIDTQSIHKQLQWLIDHVPAHITVVIASRVRLPLLINKMCINGVCREFDVEALAFSYQETKRLIKKIKGINLNEKNIIALRDRTDGWITGLHLALLAMSKLDNHEQFIEEFTGRDHDVTDYFREIVLPRQSDIIRNFLLQTSIPDQICTELCQYITGHQDSQALLEQVETNNLFLMPLDRNRTWFRYHHLFQEFLQKQFLTEQPQLFRTLQANISTWYEEKGYYPESIRHRYLAGDFERTADLINIHIKDYVHRYGEYKTLLERMQHIPDELIESRSEIRVAKALSLAVTREYKQAQNELDLFQKEYQQGNNNSILSPQTDCIMCSLAAVQCLIYLSMDDTVYLRHYSEMELKKWGNRGDAKDISIIYTSLAYACLHSFEFDYGLQIANKGIALSESCDAYVSLFGLYKICGKIAFQQGRLKEAEKFYRRGIAEAKALSREHSVTCRTIWIHLAEILYEQNNLGEAKQALDKGLDCLDDFGSVEKTIIGYQVMAKLKWEQNDPEAAYEILLHAETVGTRINVQRLVIAMAAEQVFHLLRLGDIDSAVRLSDMKGFLHTNNKLFGNDNREIVREIQKLVQVKIYIALRDTKKAKYILRNLITRANKNKRIHWLIQLLILNAEVAWLENNERYAARQLDKAIHLSASEGYCRSFLDGGSVIKQIVNKIYENCSEQEKQDNEHGMLNTLLASSKRRNITPKSNIQNNWSNGVHKLINSLTERERQILMQLRTQYSNSELAVKFYITEGTLKWHLYNIYQKLGVRNRSAAVAIINKRREA